VNLLESLAAHPYRGYAYAYPHKTAYGPLDPAVALEPLWRNEPKDALTLYVHVPICEMRCGFCNLFTLRIEPDEFEPAYLAALERQATRVLAAIGPSRFGSAALGGGTPTQLTVAGLRRVLELLEHAGATPREVPVSVETSPRTADEARLDLLRDAGVQRISIGIQSFDDRDTRAIGRPQQRSWVDGALARIRDRAFPVLNIDLIYGGEGQTPSRLLESVGAALAYAPEEMYLYPLYVRPRTGLGQKGRLARADGRVALYRAARDRLLDAGYEQVSMRFFRRAGAPPAERADTCCQQDGTVGLGCGARSYTRALHYAFEWAADQATIRDILRAYVDTPAEGFAAARHGTWLTPSEQRRRYVIKSVLRLEGLSRAAYRGFFGTDAVDDHPEIAALAAAGLMTVDADAVRPTTAGLELSDAIGPHLYSPAVRERMALHEGAAAC
jgi:oxygen-independent coproporphyrinogen-3 oxidase